VPARPAKRSSLKSYRAKRDFSQTEEPKGAAVRKASAGELRYLIQKHDATRLHYDFRVYEKKELIFAGKVGTGFDRAESARLVKKLKPLAQKTPSFKAVPNLARRGAIWIKPKLVAQINFTEWTGGNSLRHPSYQGLREDKPAKHVVREEKAFEPEGSRANQIGLGLRRATRSG
jgi:hypothetical protein